VEKKEQVSHCIGKKISKGGLSFGLGADALVWTYWLWHQQKTPAWFSPDPFSLVVYGDRTLAYGVCHNFGYSFSLHSLADGTTVTNFQFQLQTSPCILSVQLCKVQTQCYRLLLPF
jgi:hypothetical protein